MTDKELADKVVALGVGRRIHAERHFPEFDFGTPEPESICTAQSFTSDWRVAGALMEKCYYEKSCDVSTDCCYKEVEAIFSNAEGLPCITVKIEESLPRAITEACVEALT